MKKGKKLLISGFFICFVLIAAIAISFFASLVEKSFFISVGIAYLLTTINSFAGFRIIKAGYKRPAESSIKIILSGMIIRLFLMLIAVFFCLKFLEISEISFIFSILFFYIFYQIIEILYLHFEKI